MSLLHTLACGLLGFTISWLLISLIIRRSIRLGATARRQFHQTHSDPIPRLGGIAFAVALMAVSAAAYAFSVQPVGLRLNGGVILSSLAMFFLGLLDDVRPVGAKVKFGVQMLIAASVWSCGVEIGSFKNPVTDTVYDLGGWGFPVTVIWLVALTNLINLVDGLDGLAGGICFMVMCLLAYVGLHVDVSFSILLAVGMAGALLGFLFFNFPPAKIYMGDGGAYLLGFLIGVLSILNSYKGTVAVAIVAPVLALALPIADVGLAIARRWLKGLPIFRPDTKHIHHRLVHSGYSTTSTVLILYAVSLVFLLMGFSLLWSENRFLPVMISFLLLTGVVGIRSFGLIQHWLAVRKLVENPGQIRKEARYALTLGDWLEMEAERCHSIAELWESFQFLVHKLRFSQVRLQLEDGEKIWRHPGFQPAGVEILQEAHQLDVGKTMRLEFSAPKQVLPAKVFSLLTELASEAWLKAARRWQLLHRLPVRFDAAVPAAAEPSQAQL